MTTIHPQQQQQHHPIEILLACLFNLVEFIAWTINEIAGFHRCATTAAATDHDSSDAAPLDIIDCSFDFDWREYVHGLTVKQLQQLTGITNSRYKKAQLIEAALSY